MDSLNFCETFCGKLIIGAKRAVWHCFLTICFILLVFLLGTPADQIAAVMAEFNPASLCVTGSIVTLFFYGCDCILLDKSFSWGSFIGRTVGIAASFAIMLYNKTALQEVGSHPATAFLLHFTVLYFALGFARVVAELIWTDLRLNRRKET